MHEIQIENRFIGIGHPCFIVAEIGINHNGAIPLAKRMIDEAINAGADAVKFQNYRTEDFICDRSITYTYESEGEPVTESQYEMFKRYELGRGQLFELKSYCDQKGIIFFSTPTGEKGLHDLVELNVPLIKNGSDYLVHLPLVQKMAESKIPTVISTGMATLAEIDDAVRIFQAAGGTDYILLHCTSSYPTPAEDVHLSKIPKLAEVFNCPVGLSDHTTGFVAALGAVALGGCVVEKHFTLDKKLPGPDHYFSADPEELTALVSNIRILEKNIGTSAIGPTKSEELGRRDFRLSCVAAKELKTGHVLKDSDVIFCRPGAGLPPKAIEWIVGRKLSGDVLRGHVFVTEDF